jgi:WD40 repeat protein
METCGLFVVGYADGHVLVVDFGSEAFEPRKASEGAKWSNWLPRIARRNVHERTSISQFDLPGLDHGIVSLASSRDSSLIAACDAKGHIRVWRWKPQQVVAAFCNDYTPAAGMDIVADGRQIVTGSADRRIRLWDLESLKAAVTFEAHESELTAFLASPERPAIVSAARDGAIRVWNSERLQSHMRLRDDHDPISHVDVAPNGSIVLAAAANAVHSFGIDRANNARKIMSYRRHAVPVTSVRISSKGDLFASGDRDGRIVIWGITGTREGRKQFRAVHAAVDRLCFSPSDDLLASAGEDGTIVVCDIASETVLASLSAPQTRFESIDFFDESTIRLVLPQAGERLARLSAAPSLVRSVSLPCGRLCDWHFRSAEYRAASTSPSSDPTDGSSHEGPVGNLICRGDGRTFLEVSNHDGSVTLSWLPHQMQQIVPLPGRRGVVGVKRNHLFVYCLEEQPN